jgi:hypothetical protein
MPATYEKIATTTLGSATSTITLSSIPSTYTDLRLVFVGNLTTSTAQPRIRFNSDTTTNYSDTSLTGDGANPASGRDTSATWIYLFKTGLIGTTPSLSVVDIFSYSSTSINKTCLINTSNDKNGSGTIENLVGLWRSTAAINSINISTSGNNFAIGTTATLYGILKA